MRGIEKAGAVLFVVVSAALLICPMIYLRNRTVNYSRKVEAETHTTPVDFGSMDVMLITYSVLVVVAAVCFIVYIVKD